MKQKQQTKNKHSGSARARSDQCIMDKQNRLKSILEAKKSDSQLQKNAEELRNNYYAIPNVKDAELTAVDEDLHLLEVRLESLEAATIRHHIEKYKHEFPDTVELLDRNFYVDDLISGGNEFEEAL
ncbi:hypothetical protein TNCV_1547181 [Trichonephila clavipes]|nr:hypothetical protein TNCV_1547181 [Trichonephila clavipes]